MCINLKKGWDSKFLSLKIIGSRISYVVQPLHSSASSITLTLSFTGGDGNGLPEQRAEGDERADRHAVLQQPARLHHQQRLRPRVVER